MKIARKTTLLLFLILASAWALPALATSTVSLPGINSVGPGGDIVLPLRKDDLEKK